MNKGTSFKSGLLRGLIACACLMVAMPAAATAAGTNGTNASAAQSVHGNSSGNSPSVAIKWQQSIGAYLPTTPVRDKEGNLYVTGLSGRFLDSRADRLTAWKQDGTGKWALPLQDALHPPIVGDDGTVYVADGRLLAIDPEQGTVKWTFALPDVALVGQPVLHDGVLYVSDDDSGKLYAVDIQGQQLWAQSIAGHADRLSPIAFDADGNAYAVSTNLVVPVDEKGMPIAATEFDSVLHAIDKDGAPLWQLKLNGLGPMAEAPFITASGDIIVGKDALFAVSRQGKLKWTSPVRMAFNPSDASMWNGSIYYANYGTVYVLSESGKEQQLFSAFPDGNLQGHLWIAPDNGAAYSWLENRKIGAWSMDGSERFLYEPAHRGSVDTAASIIAGPNGILYTGYADAGKDGKITDGYILAFTDVTPAKPSDSSPIAIYLNQDKLALQTKPEQLHGRLFLPMRETFAALGAAMQYDAATKTIRASKGATRLTYVLGAYTADLNGQPVQLDVPGKLIGNRTMVPLRFVSEALGYSVIWDAASNTIKIVTRQGI